MKRKLFPFFIGCLLSAGCGVGVGSQSDTIKTKIASYIQSGEFSSLGENEGNILLKPPHIYKRKF